MAELSFAVPQVIAHRLARLAMAGHVPSVRDKKEFELMVAEKKGAFDQSWQAMTSEAIRANQALSVSLFKAFWLSNGRLPSGSVVAAGVHRAALGVMAKGLEPVHRTAVANAKRLSTTKLR